MYVLYKNNLPLSHNYKLCKIISALAPHCPSPSPRSTEPQCSPVHCGAAQPTQHHSLFSSSSCSYQSFWSLLLGHNPAHGLFPQGAPEKHSSTKPSTDSRTEISDTCNWMCCLWIQNRGNTFLSLTKSQIFLSFARQICHATARSCS